MPTITLEVVDHAVLVVLVAVLPFTARRRFRAVEQGVAAGDPNTRVRSYRSTIAVQWALTAAIAAVWLALGRTASSIGLVAGIAALAILGYTLTATAIGAQLSLTRSVFRSETARSKARASVADVRAMIPHTPNERRWFNAMAITAGICEEVIYRGFLFAYFAAWMPEAPALVVIVLAALVFGLVHLYQGAAGVVKITIIGILFGTLYWMTGSVWPLMALHVVVDVSSGWMGWKFVQEGDFDEPATPVAA